MALSEERLLTPFALLKELRGWFQSLPFTSGVGIEIEGMSAGDGVYVRGSGGRPFWRYELL